MPEELRPQILLQLREQELELAWPYLTRGVFGLEVLDFASPQVLDGDWEIRMQKLQALCGSIPGPITMHGPFLDLSPASPEPRLRALTRERYRQALRIAKALAARYLVLHTQFNPNLRQPNYPAIWLEGNLRFFRELLPEIEAAQTTVVLENMWDQAPDHVARLLRELPAERFAACLDAGHAHLHAEVSWQKWIEIFGDRLAYVHLSDNHGGWDEHLALGRGNVDFVRLLDALRGCSRLPWFVLEVPRWHDARQSLQYLEQIDAEAMAAVRDLVDCAQDESGG